MTMLGVLYHVCGASIKVYKYLCDLVFVVMVICKINVHQNDQILNVNVFTVEEGLDYTATGRGVASRTHVLPHH